MFRAHFSSMDTYLPQRSVANEDLDQFPKAAQTLISLKTGIKSRRHASDEETVSYMGAEAALSCLAKSGVAAEDIDCIIVATSSPEKIHPPTSALIQEKIQAYNACAFDINVVCSGGIYGISVATAFIESGKFKKVLLIATEKYSSFLNPKDISTYPYFGDGAAAILFSASSDHKSGVLATVLHTDGRGNSLIQVPAGGSLLPGWQVKNNNDFYFYMDGQAVFQFVKKVLPEILIEVCGKAGIDIGLVDKIIPHQANAKMLEAIFSDMGIDASKAYIDVSEIGNTAAASPLIALNSAMVSGQVKKNDLVALVAFGGGLSWAASLIKL